MFTSWTLAGYSVLAAIAVLIGISLRSGAIVSALMLRVLIVFGVMIVRNWLLDRSTIRMPKGWSDASRLVAVR